LGDNARQAGIDRSAAVFALRFHNNLFPVFSKKKQFFKKKKKKIPQLRSN